MIESRECLGKHVLESELDLRVKELRSSLWTRARRHRNKFFKSGNGTSRSSSRGGGEGKSLRGVVEVTAEVRLNNLAHSRLLMYPRGWKSDTLGASQFCGEESRELMGELKSLWDTGRCCHTAWYCW